MPEQRLPLRGSSEPFSGALDALAGLLPAAQPALLLQVSVLDPAADQGDPCPAHGMRHSDFGTGFPFACGLCKAAGAEAHHAPLSV